DEQEISCNSLALNNFCARHQRGGAGGQARRGGAGSEGPASAHVRQVPQRRRFAPRLSKGLPQTATMSANFPMVSSPRSVTTANSAVLGRADADGPEGREAPVHQFGWI